MRDVRHVILENIFKDYENGKFSDLVFIILIVANIDSYRGYHLSSENPSNIINVNDNHENKKELVG